MAEQTKSQNKAETKTEKRKRVKEEAQNFVQDFKSFAFKGNVIDLAVGVVIGAAFNNIVNSLAKDIIQPPIGKLLGNAAFTDLFINLNSNYYPTLTEAEAAGEPVIKYGLFLSNVINFLITAISLYIILRIFFRRKREEEGSK